MVVFVRDFDMHIAAASDSQKEHLDISWALFRFVLTFDWFLLAEELDRLDNPFALLNAAARGSSELIPALPYT